MNLSIFDQTEQRKQVGIELVYQHANSYWKQAAAERLLEVINTQEYLTSDDVLENLETRGITTGDNRAIAAILMSASRMGLITSTDTFVRCRRKSRHHAPIMRWKSNNYKEQK